jgi:hypothetical protein
MRTVPRKVLPEPLVHEFISRLNSWGMETLGLNTGIQPWLSLYVNGCGQGLHNDSLSGQMGYVFSLTRWEGRNFLGGETVLFRPESYWESHRITAAAAQMNFCDKVPARFNQLLVFDDRLLHGVAPLQGTMEPQSGRVVLHGHLKADRLGLDGPLTPEQVDHASVPTREAIRSLARQHAPFVHGFITLRVMIQPDGRVASVHTLCDRLVPLSADRNRLDPLRQDIAGLLSGITFPPSTGTSRFTLPVLVGS